MLRRIFSAAKRLIPGVGSSTLPLNKMRTFHAQVAISPYDMSLLLEQMGRALIWTGNEIIDGNGFNPEGRQEFFTASVNGVGVRFELTRMCLILSGDVTDILVSALGGTNVQPICQTLGLKCKPDDDIGLYVRFSYEEAGGIGATQAVALNRFTIESEDEELDCLEALYLLGLV